MVTAIIILLFVGYAIWLFRNVIAINKIVLKRLAGSGVNPSKPEWLQIGKHVLYILAGLVIFLVLIVITYYFGFWRSGEFHIYY